MRDSARHVLSLVLLFTMLAVPLIGCSQAAKTPQGTGMDDSIATLASGGVAVMDNFNSATPLVALTGTPSAMRFTRWQLQNLLAEANGHAGYIGSELDTLATPPKGAPPLSTFIGAWLTRNDGVLAHYANGIMGDQDYKKCSVVVFPTIVVLTFIADIARVSPTAQSRLPSIQLEGLIATPAEADGLCSAVAGWVSGVVNSVTNAVRANGSGWLASLWNTAVSLVGTAITVLINGLEQSLVGFITKIASICGTLMQVASLFKPWTVKLTANPSTITLDSYAEPGAFDATLDAKDIPWPAELVSCVTEVSGGHIDLTDASYKDAPVTWTQPINIPGLATKQSEDDTLLDDKTAHYTYATKTVEVPGDDDCPTLHDAGKIGITVRVARSDITKTLMSIEALITGQLNSSIQSYLQPYIEPAVDAVTDVANKFAAPHESAIVSLKETFADPLCEHTPPANATPSPAPSPTAAGFLNLPFEPCTELIAEGNTATFLSGATVLPNLEYLDKLNSAIIATGTEQSGSAPSGYDGTRASVCMLGVGSGDDAKLVAEFAVIPHGPQAYVNPDIDADGVDPTSCRALVGYALLDRFHADCWDSGIGQVKLDTPSVQLMLIAVAPLTKGAGAVIPVQKGQFEAVLKSILENSR